MNRNRILPLMFSSFGFPLLFHFTFKKNVAIYSLTNSADGCTNGFQRLFLASVSKDIITYLRFFFYDSQLIYNGAVVMMFFFFKQNYIEVTKGSMSQASFLDMVSHIETISFLFQCNFCFCRETFYSFTIKHRCNYFRVVVPFAFSSQAILPLLMSKTKFLHIYSHESYHSYPKIWRRYSQNLPQCYGLHTLR